MSNIVTDFRQVSVDYNINKCWNSPKFSNIEFKSSNKDCFDGKKYNQESIGQLMIEWAVWESSHIVLKFIFAVTSRVYVPGIYY